MASNHLDLRGKNVFLTGASSGLGLSMARLLAKDYGANLVVVARRTDRLLELKRELEVHGVTVTPIAADLTREDDALKAFEQATSNQTVHAAILNAGVTVYGNAIDHSHDDVSPVLKTNVSGVVLLAQTFAKHLVAHNQGGIMFVSSMAGFAPMPYQAVYGATKAFVTSYGLALGHELKSKNVSVTVFAPGGIATEMLNLSGLSRNFKSDDFGIMPADICAKLAVEAFVKRKRLFVPGSSNKIASFAMRHAPHGIVTKVIDRMYRGGVESPASGT